MKDENKAKAQLITELKELRQRSAEIAESEIERKKAEERIKHLNLVLRAIRNVNQLIVKENDRETLIRKVCKLLTESRGYSYAWIVLFDENYRPIESISSNLGNKFVSLKKMFNCGEMNECGKRAMRQAGVVTIDDTAKYCVGCPLLGEAPSEREFTVRLEHNSNIYGLLSVSIPRNMTADREEKNVFEEIAGDLAYALHGIEVEEERKRAEETLKQERYLMNIFMDNVPDAIYFKDIEGKFLRVNKAQANRLRVKNQKEAIGKTDFDFFHREDTQTSTDDENEIIRTGKVLIEERKKKKLDGGDEWLLATKLPLYDTKDIIFGTFGMTREITDIKKAEEQIKKDLKEKTLLLSEIHHRVNNNFQVITSLLYLQSQQIKEKHIINLFNQTRNRIYMMASVHEKLYHTKNFTSIDFKEYLEDVLNRLFRQSEISHRVKLVMEVKDVVLGIDDAIPVALLINELFTNSIKHAFPEDKKGTIRITFNLLDEDTYQLIFQDNGVGLPEEIDFETSETFSLNLVRMLAKQITGEATFEQDDWTTFKIVFKGYEYGKKKYSNC